MIMVRSVECALIRAVGFFGEKLLMAVAAKDFMRRQAEAEAAACLTDPLTDAIYAFGDKTCAEYLGPYTVLGWGCFTHGVVGPCAKCLVDEEPGGSGVVSDPPTPAPELAPGCVFAAAVFPQYLKQ